ncbi:MAG: Asp-tRNA(Asn)/Glu-tRNA(Gln) amidotransferase subunit GatC [Acidobacteria bacterium]|nr:Asp-tRNA(Asn)/Glu-tRNA(Gln) amidotransferase subunit GatC [Acidobacteriota bacterium]
MPITVEEVLKIANLANLSFSQEQLEHFTHQFQEILNYVAQLEEVPTEHVTATFHTILSRETPVRQDATAPSLPVERAMANAPDAVEGQFRVPRVIE